MKFQKGHKTNLGKKYSEEHRKKISEALTGRKLNYVVWNKGKKGCQVAWNKGIPLGYIPKMAFKKNDERITGENSYKWKGDKVGYSGVHIWLRKHKGSPNKCEQCGIIGARRYEWANISGKYLRDIKDYLRLCHSCHMKMDFKEETREKLRRNALGNTHRHDFCERQKKLLEAAKL